MYLSTSYHRLSHLEILRHPLMRQNPDAAYCKEDLLKRLFENLLIRAFSLTTPGIYSPISGFKDCKPYLGKFTI